MLSCAIIIFLGKAHLITQAHLQRLRGRKADDEAGLLCDRRCGEQHYDVP